MKMAPSRRYLGRTEASEEACESKAVIIYQAAARYVSFGCLKVAGGVRVLVDVAQKQGYVQVISPMCEVFVTHMVSSLAFLNSSSAAGVAWCAVVYEPPKETDNQGYGSQIPRRSFDQGKPTKDTTHSDKIDMAQVVFCDPLQAQRFRVVLETIRSAISDDACMIVPAVPPCLGPAPTQPTPGMMVDPCCGSGPMFVPAAPPCGPQDGGSIPCAPKDSCGAPPGLDFSIPQTCAPSSGSTCEPYDPYAYDNRHSKVIFTAPACIVRLEKDDQWLDMHQGHLKVIQLPNRQGYNMHLDTGNPSLDIIHPIRTDMLFEVAPKAQFGFMYKAMIMQQRGCVQNRFLVSFKCQVHFDQFKCIVSYIHGVLSMLGHDKCENQPAFVCGNQPNSCNSNNNSGIQTGSNIPNSNQNYGVMASTNSNTGHPRSSYSSQSNSSYNRHYQHSSSHSYTDDCGKCLSAGSLAGTETKVGIASDATHDLSNAPQESQATSRICCRSAETASHRDPRASKREMHNAFRKLLFKSPVTAV